MYTQRLIIDKTDNTQKLCTLCYRLNMLICLDNGIIKVISASLFMDNVLSSHVDLALKAITIF